MQQKKLEELVDSVIRYKKEIQLDILLITLAAAPLASRGSIFLMGKKIA